MVVIFSPETMGQDVRSRVTTNVSRTEIADACTIATFFAKRISHRKIITRALKEPVACKHRKPPGGAPRIANHPRIMRAGSSNAPPCRHRMPHRHWLRTCDRTNVKLQCTSAVRSSFSRRPWQFDDRKVTVLQFQNLWAQHSYGGIEGELASHWSS